MATANLEVIIDGDGHIQEDNEAISSLMPSFYKENDALRFSLFPPLDHLHSAHAVVTSGQRARKGARVGPDEWSAFLQDVGIDTTVLYPTGGLAYGKIVNRDWSIALCQAYNNWLAETYVQRSPRFKGIALIPMQEPQAAVEELRRAVKELGMVGAMLPSTGLPNHLGAIEYWSVYEEAERLGCCLAVHGGAHSGIGLDHMNVYTPVHALGHPFGITISFAGILFNGIFDRYPGLRMAFLEGGVSWFLLCLERFDRSHETHTEYHLRREELRGPGADEKVSEYIREHVQAGQIYVGCEGPELSLGCAVKAIGREPFMYSSDFPHEVTNESCKEEIHELLENEELTAEDKAAILHGNAQRFYGLKPVSA